MLIDHLLDQVLEPLLVGLVPGTVVSVLDPACGDGRFLAAARARIERCQGLAVLVGIDLDAETAATAAGALGPDAQIHVGSGLTREWGDERFDVVVGNPPFLNQLSTATTRGKRSSHGGGPYANSAAEFLALAVRLARPDGGRVGLVLPLSTLSTRDAGPIRSDVESIARLTSCWWAPREAFEAQVRTCALGFVTTGPTTTPTTRPTTGPTTTPTTTPTIGWTTDSETLPIAQFYGLTFEPRPPIVRRTGAATWSWLLAGGLGIPALPKLATNGTLGDRATVTCDFRDEYYGLVGAVSDEGDGAPLVTCGLIDPGRCLWGARPTRFAKQRYLAPRVDLTRVTESIAAWARLRLVPKVLVANQTRIIEAVADPLGELLPSVPVVSVIPTDPTLVDSIAAVLTSAVASVWLGHRSAGAGLSATALRVSPPVLSGLVWPSGDLSEAVVKLRAGDARGCSAAVATAFGLDEQQMLAIDGWWSAALR